jgi:hypothetical protein
MIQRVIVLETDRASADQIIRALRDNRIDTATVATSMRETCHFVAHRTFDLALIPLEYLRHQLDTLRRIEPDLHFILTAKSRDSFQDSPMGESALGVIPLDDLDPLLAELLTDADDVPQIPDTIVSVEIRAVSQDPNCVKVIRLI